MKEGAHTPFLFLRFSPLTKQRAEPPALNSPHPSVASTAGRDQRTRGKDAQALQTTQERSWGRQCKHPEPTAKVLRGTSRPPTSQSPARASPPRPPTVSRPIPTAKSAAGRDHNSRGRTRKHSNPHRTGPPQLIHSSHRTDPARAKRTQA